MMLRVLTGKTTRPIHCLNRLALSGTLQYVLSLLMTGMIIGLRYCANFAMEHSGSFLALMCYPGRAMRFIGEETKSRVLMA